MTLELLSIHTHTHTLSLWAQMLSLYLSGWGQSLLPTQQHWFPLPGQFAHKDLFPAKPPPPSHRHWSNLQDLQKAEQRQSNIWGLFCVTYEAAVGPEPFPNEDINWDTGMGANTGLLPSLLPPLHQSFCRCWSVVAKVHQHVKWEEPINFTLMFGNMNLQVSQLA